MPYKNLTQKEKDFVKKHPITAYSFKQAADKARKEAKKRYSGPGLHNGKGDAFRHAYWNALMVKADGEVLAKEFADAHEKNPNQPAKEKAMDLHNNSVGRSIGMRHRRSSDAMIANEVDKALKKYQLHIIP